MKIRHKVWFGRARGILWVLLGLISIPLGWAQSVALVWFASAYANAESGFATAEGADDRKVLAAIAELRAEVRESRCSCSHQA
jgi:hypothetical protein